MTTIGIYKTYTEADLAIQELKNTGVSDSDISYLHLDKQGAIKDEEGVKKTGQGAATGAGVGALIGGIAGLAVAGGILPGLGALLVAGPLMGVLGLGAAATTVAAGIATGVVAGGLVGALVTMGVSKEDAEIYVNMVRQGDILVVVRTETLDPRPVLERTNAREIRQYA